MEEANEEAGEKAGEDEERVVRAGRFQEGGAGTEEDGTGHVGTDEQLGNAGEADKARVFGS